MEKLSDLEYLQLHKFGKILYNLKCFFFGIPGWFLNLFKAIWAKIKGFGLWIKDDVVDIYNIFVHGKWQTKVSYLVMGFGSAWRGQWGRGILFFLFEVVFILYNISRNRDRKIPEGELHRASRRAPASVRP